jgi:hypothetical protein
MMTETFAPSDLNRRRPRAYGYGPRAVSADTRPLIAIDIDGVIALEDPPEVAATAHEVTAWGKWRREVTIANGTAETIHLLAERCEIAWASAWSYTAHEAFRDALSLPSEPWTFLPAQFHAEAAIAEYAAGRRWAWIIESPAGTGLSWRYDGLIVTVDPHRGLPSIDPAGLLSELGVS